MTFKEFVERENLSELEREGFQEFIESKGFDVAKDFDVDEWVAQLEDFDGDLAGLEADDF